MPGDPVAQVQVLIREKKAVLEAASSALKAHFVGLDNVIDEIIDNISAWYIMPDLITRPVIINLWGLTGVGKTDLVRRLVKLLGFNDRFVEIQLTQGGAVPKYGDLPSVQDSLNCSDITPDKPGVLLLDEIQNFRTIDDEAEKDAGAYYDLWTLLSDGKFSQTDMGIKNRIFAMVLDDDYFTDFSDGDKSQTMSFAQARFLKKFLKLPEPLAAIMKWDKAKRNKMLVNKINDHDIYDGDNYSKLLIFVSGNLDEAFTMAGSLADIDVDADIFHNLSRSIDVIAVKKALKHRFKPEQISRLGNTHVIYPSLGKDSYRMIIRRKASEVAANVLKLYGLELVVDSSVDEFLYRNGVYPTQGTRPLLSTMSSCLEANVPGIVLRALESGLSAVAVSYNAGTSTLDVVSPDGSPVHSVKVVGNIDRIRAMDDKVSKRKVIAAVHEAGHALVYGMEFGLAPLQVISDSVDNCLFGFVSTHNIMPTRSTMEMELSVTLAGLAAEEIFFGDEHRTTGSDNDLEKATAMAGAMIRKHAMGGRLARMVPEHYADESVNEPTMLHKDPSGASDEMIESMLRAGLDRSRRTLMDNFKLYMSLVDTLLSKGRMTADEVAEAFASKGMQLRMSTNDDIIFHEEFGSLFKSKAKEIANSNKGKHKQ